MCPFMGSLDWVYRGVISFEVVYADPADALLVTCSPVLPQVLKGAISEAQDT